MTKTRPIAVPHVLGLAEVLAEVRKLKKEILDSVEDKMLLSEEKFGARIVRIETAADADRMDLKSFKSLYERGHNELTREVRSMGETNTIEHRTIMATLSTLKSGQDEIFTATKAVRATVRAQDAWNTYKKETHVGRFIGSKGGKVFLAIVGTFFFLSVLHSLGLEAVDPMGWLEGVIEKILPKAIN